LSKLIYLKWRDACKQEYTITKKQIDDKCIVETVGTLVNETDDIYSIALNAYPEEDTFEYVMHIPKNYVIKKRILK